MATLVIDNGKLLTPDGFLPGGRLVIEGGRITGVGPAAEVPMPEAAQVVDVRGQIVAPGFIDIHVHGAAGSDFSDEDATAFATICRYHAGGGTTALLGTTSSMPPDRLREAVRRVAEAKLADTGGARILGVHVEGPFFVVDWRGCHLPEYVRPPTDAEVDGLLEYAEAIESITLSPEIENGLSTVARFAEAGVTVSCGHSDASSELLQEAIARGVRHSTHMYCAMGSIRHEGPARKPGVVETILASDEITTELIADDIHVPALMMRLTVRAKGCDRVCLVSDAMRGAGMPDGNYTFGPRDGKICFVRDGISVMPENTGYASSVIRLDDAVRTMVRQVGLAEEEALRMASAVPARIIGWDDRKGRLEVGMDGDAVVLDQDLRAQVTVVAVGVMLRSAAAGSATGPRLCGRRPRAGRPSWRGSRGCRPPAWRTPAPRQPRQAEEACGLGCRSAARDGSSPPRPLPPRAWSQRGWSACSPGL